VKTKGTYLQAQFQRLRARCGPKKAIIAVAVSMLTAAYYILRDGIPYKDLGSEHFTRRNKEHAANTSAIKNRARMSRAIAAMSISAPCPISCAISCAGSTAPAAGGTGSQTCRGITSPRQCIPHSRIVAAIRDRGLVVRDRHALRRPARQGGANSRKPRELLFDHACAQDLIDPARFERACRQCGWGRSDMTAAAAVQVAEVTGVAKHLLGSSHRRHVRAPAVPRAPRPCLRRIYP